MKIAAISHELARFPTLFQHTVVHTGQHYDDLMSRVFLDQLEVPEPDHFLDVGSGTHAQQAARVMERLEPALIQLAPDILLVPGDVNSTMAAALTAVKLGIAVGHVEAGLRSFDRTMPEELNRVVTDTVSSLLFVHSPEAVDHLLREGADERSIHYVGNTMIDTLVRLRQSIDETHMAERLGVERGRYLVVTLHRPALVDGDLLGQAMSELNEISRKLPVVFPMHPRTRAALDRDAGRNGEVRLMDPVGYLEFLSLIGDASAVLTDSGGIQEETTFLGVPCFTLRDNTERPVTVEMGTNRLLGLEPRRIREIPDLLSEGIEPGSVPPLWDGKAAERVVAILRDFSPAA